MAAGVGIDPAGNPRKVVGTSEPNGYLRPGVGLEPDEELARGTGHAEVNIIDHMRNNQIAPVAMGAGRPICSPCEEYLSRSNTRPATELKSQIRQANT